MYNNKHHQFDTQYNHKLFAHANRWGNDVIDYIAELRPKVVKFLDPNLDSVRAVRELLPDALLIYRKWKPNQPLGDSEHQAFQLGSDFGREIASEEIVRQGFVNLVEGYNEVMGETAPASEHIKYASFQLGFRAGLLQMAPHVQPVAFNFGTGNMSAELIMDHYHDVLDTYDWLGFHEYDWPRMDRLHQQGISDGNGGMWLALRYRRIMEPIINQLGNKWSVVISECGMTQGVLAGQDVGFLHPHNTIQGEWGSYPTPISSEDYWATLQWYSDELMQDDYVAGACMFVTGGLSPWESFETIGTITPKIKDYQQIIDNGGNMPSDIFVNDVRSPDDPSLEAHPRINTFEELQALFGLDVDTSQGEKRATNGQRYWKLVGFEVRTGPAVYIPQVKEKDGSPAANIVVFRHWPSADPLPPGIDPSYFPNAAAGATDTNGVVGFGFEQTSVTGPDGGPDYIWISSDPPGGTRVGSDMASKLGTIGGTNHMVANPIVQDTLKGDDPTTPPPTIPGDNSIQLIIGGKVVYAGRFEVVVE
jgi:hypothetical protein